MSSFVSTDFAVKAMRNHQCKYWKMVDSDGKSVIAEQKSDEVTVEQAIAQLEETLLDVRGKYVCLNVRSKGGKSIAGGGDLSSGIFNWKILLDNAQAVTGMPKAEGSSDSQTKSFMEQISLLRLEMAEQNHRHQQERLRDEIKELKEAAKDSNPMIDQIITGLGRMFQGNPTGNVPATALTPPVAALAGTDHSNGTRIKTALKQLSKVDPEMISNLELLASFAKKNPDKYQNAISMLKSMA